MKHTNSHTKTNSSEEPYRLPTITLIIFGIIFVLAAGLPIFTLTSAFIQGLTITADSPIEKIFKYIYLLIVGSILSFIIITPIGWFIGKFRAKLQIKREDTAIQLANPYQYYKELPNYFGIGVASLLDNSALENEKDVIAAILDLCAQGYLHLSKHSDHYVIRLVPHSPRTPLSNEAYLLELIQRNSLKNIDFHKWYQLCVSDGVNLGLFQPIRLPKDPPISRSARRAKRRASELVLKKSSNLYLIGFFILIIAFVAVPLLLPEDIAQVILISLFFLLVFLAVFQTVGSLFFAGRELFRDSTKESYKTTLEKHLHRTPQGVAELQKLLAFRKFLAQFNTFVDKDPEAVILWDRYLSYAQVFGLAQEIMRSGYSQLIDNAAFRIDDIDNITLGTIQLLQ